jgi:YidC/Oxa1 family membrane protein insertase
MPFWNQLVEILRESIFAYAQICHGNLGWGILVVTFLTRLALVPLGIRLARSARMQQQAMQRIQPELQALRVTFKGNPGKLAEETQRLMKREGVAVIPNGLLGNIVQVPILIALYSAVRQASTVGGRFAWISDISKSDLLLTVVVSGVTMAATITGTTTSSSNQTVVILFSAIITAMVLSKTAAGVGLYWGLSTLFSAIQGVIVQRSIRLTAA